MRHKRLENWFSFYFAQVQTKGMRFYFRLTLKNISSAFCCKVVRKKYRYVDIFLNKAKFYIFQFYFAFMFILANFKFWLFIIVCFVHMSHVMVTVKTSGNISICNWRTRKTAQTNFENTVCTEDLVQCHWIRNSNNDTVV